MNVTNTIGLTDLMTPTMRHIINTMNMMISSMIRVDQISDNIGQESFSGMQREIRAAEIELNRMNQQLTGIQPRSDNINQGFSRWALTLGGVYAAIGLIRMGITKLVQITKISDEYTGINARVALINDGLQTQAELQDKIMRSANSTRSSYTATADLIAKIGMTGVMKTNDEAIGFADKINKLIKIGGGTAMQNEASLMQLSQALASGVLQGDEFRSLRENAPALMATLAKGMDVSIGKLREMSAEGELTSQVIIEAMNKMGTEIDAQFAMMPRKFAENATIVRNVIGSWLADIANADEALGKLNLRFTNFVNWISSENGMKFLQSVATGLNFIITLILFGTDFIGELITTVNSLGGIWEGVFSGVIIAALLIAIPLIWAKVTAILALAQAWVMLYAPVLVIALAIGMVIATLVHFGITARDVVTFVGGLFGALVGHIVNSFIYLYNMLGQFAVFFVNMFIDPIFAVQNLFYNLIENIIGYFNSLVNGIIDGLNWIIQKANSVGANINTIGHQDFSNPMKQPIALFSGTKTFKNKDFVDYSSFASKGASMATGFLDKFSGSSIEKAMTGQGLGGFGAGNDIGDIGKVGKIGKIEQDVNIADEDIKMLMEMAVQNRVNQINLNVETTAAQITNHNSISSAVDADQLLDYMAQTIQEGASISVKEYHG